MSTKTFCCNPRLIEEYYSNQVGNGLPVFSGSRVQKGHGIGSLLSKMALVHEQSCPCLKTELDLFALPPTQTAVEKGMWIGHQPLSSLSDAY